MAYENPSGAIYVHSKEQFTALLGAMATISNVLDNINQEEFEDEKLNVEIKAVTKNCFRIEIGGLLNISDDTIQKLMKA